MGQPKNPFGIFFGKSITGHFGLQGIFSYADTTPYPDFLPDPKCSINIKQTALNSNHTFVYFCR
jgi:hypothetical protein